MTAIEFDGVSCGVCHAKFSKELPYCPFCSINNAGAMRQLTEFREKAEISLGIERKG